MKVALVCFNLTWQAGGVRLLYEEAHALERLGHTAILYAPEFDPGVYPELVKGIDVRIIRPSKPIKWQYQSKHLFGRVSEKLEQRRRLVDAARCIAAAMDADFDLVNVHDFAYRAASFYKPRNPRAKIVWYMADPPYQYLPKANPLYDLASRFFNWYADYAERRYFRSIDAAAVLVQRNKAWLEARGVPATINWTGIDFKSFYAPPREVSREKPFTIVAVGALNQYRRFEDAIEAVQILRDAKYDARIVVVCKNIWGENEYQEKLERLVAARGLGERVRLLFGGATEAELKHLYAAGHVFVLPIHLPPPRNGFGWQMTAFEAMAAGMPVLVCRSNDVTEALMDRETALFVDPLRPDQIAESVRSLIDVPRMHRKIAAAGQEFVRKNMSWEKFACGILETAKTTRH